MLTLNFKYLPFKSGDLVLDLGCGEGRHTIAACYHDSGINVIAVDLNHQDLQTARQRHKDFDSESLKSCLYLQSDGEKLPFDSNTFDHIICSEVLEHIPEYENFLVEISRILKPGGTLNVSVPRFWPEKICWHLSEAYYQVPGGHVRIFKASELRKKIESFRFHFKARHWAHALHAPYWWLRCAFWSYGDSFFLVRWYHKLLVWDLIKRPRLTRALDQALNPIMGKSVVMYFKKTEIR